VSHVELAVAAPADAEETVAAVLAACGTTGSWIPRPGEVRAYFRAPAPGIEQRFATAWRETTGRPNPFPLEVRLVRREDWLGRWRSKVRPIRVGRRLWIAPPGCVADAAPPARVVRIEPGLGFGTGAHPTTRALLAWIEETEPAERVLDVGTGSGVLALAAVAGGARWALGLDVDDLALDNAARNRDLNGRTGSLRLVRGTVDALRSGTRFDLLVANLDGPTLARILPQLGGHLAPGGRCGVAGCLAPERNVILARARAGGFELLDERCDPDPMAGDAWWSGWFAAP
jgi:ribosomal protein L11 methyltransferase